MLPRGALAANNGLLPTAKPELVGFAGALRRSEIVALDVADVTPVAEGLVVNKRAPLQD